MKNKLIVIAGPTASGKSAVSVELAKMMNGEIISADSMQIYKYMDIGSAKITEDEMQGIKHHLVDALMPHEAFNVNRFQTMAYAAMDTIYAQGKQPIIAGGTGFYIQAVTRQIDFSSTDQEQQVRNRVESFYQENGDDALYRWLKDVDPASCVSIHQNNVKRVKRALEYFLLTGEKISEHNELQREKESPYELYFFVLNMERDLLYHRIDRRVDLMVENGLVEEVTHLKEMGYTKDMTAMQGLGYKEMLDYLDGHMTLDEAIYLIKRDTRHFAKRQLTWFRRESDVRWIAVDHFNFDAVQIAQHIFEEIKSNA